MWSPLLQATYSQSVPTQPHRPDSSATATSCLTAGLLTLLQTHGFRGRIYCLNCRRCSSHDADTFRGHHERQHRQMLQLCERKPDGGRLWCPECQYSTYAANVPAMLEHGYVQHWRRFGCLVCAEAQVPMWFADPAAVRKHHANSHGLRGERGWRCGPDWRATGGWRDVLVSMPSGLVVTWAEVEGREEALGNGVLAGWSGERAARLLEQLDVQYLERSLQRKPVGRPRRQSHDVAYASGMKIRIRMRRDCADRAERTEAVVVDGGTDSDDEPLAGVDLVMPDNKVLGLRNRRVGSQMVRKKRAHIVKCHWCRVEVRANTVERCRRTLAVHARLNHAELLGAGDEQCVEPMEADGESG